ncbi:LAETG motif-containing sortase-dependent surface protein [Streptodolium elevatio]|uniref:LAETG motif-containing sortase-dependent surface protein n=1 Tax=Streptodolium elevatio TaxID=3157996 RepID=A0ABV3DBN6_9ACTN
MLPNLRRRTRMLAVGATLGATAGLAVGGAAPAAHADEGPERGVHVQAIDALVASRAVGGGDFKMQWVRVSNNNPAPARDLVVNVDASALSGVAEVKWPEECKGAGLTAKCEVDALGSYSQATLWLGFRALPGAADGTTRTVKYSGTTANVGDVKPTTQQIEIASGVDLVASQNTEREGAVPGSKVDVPVSVRNVGNRPADGVTIGLWSSQGLAFSERYENCRYSDYGNGNVIGTCQFDQTLEPGVTYELEKPIPLKLDADTVRGRFTYSAHAGASAAKSAADAGAKAGTAGALKLVKKASPQAAARELDTSDNTSQTTVWTTLKADPAVSDVSVTGAAGTVAQAKITVQNKGTGLTDNNGGIGGLSFDVPDGAEVAKLPEYCTTYSDAGKARVSCTILESVKPGGSLDVPFELKLVRATGASVGAIEFDTAIDLPGFNADTSNDKAELTLTVTGSGTTTGGSTSTGGSSGNGSGTSGGSTGQNGGAAAAGAQPPADNGPELAETGGSSSTALIAGVGGGLLVVAAAAFVVVRRRRSGDVAV